MPHSSTSTHPAAQSMSPGLIVLLLSLLLGLQPLTTDLYLPALPTLTHDLGAAVSQAQLTLSALLLAFGSSQLIWGPLSDRYGRKPILLLGLGAYLLASLASAMAPTIAWLIGWRCVQGAALGAAVMCARAIVRDLYQPLDGARVMSKALTGLGIIACLSAPVGAALAQWLGWRAVLLALALCAALALAMIALRFDETVQHKNPQALRLSALLRTWWRIVRHPTFVAFSALSICSYGGLFTFLASSSFVFIKVLGLSKVEFGLAMFGSSLSYIGGTFLCRHLLATLGLKRSVAIAGAISLIAGSTMGVLALAGWQSVWTLLPPFFLFMVGHGIHQPCSQTAAVGPFPHAAGAASALNGFLMMVAAFAIGSWLGVRLDDTVAPLSNGVWFWGVCLAVVAWTLVQRHDHHLPREATRA